MLTVETEVNGDSKSTYEKGPSLVGFLELVMLVQCRFLFSLGYSSRLSTKYFSLTVHYLNSHTHPPSKLGRQSC